MISGVFFAAAAVLTIIEIRAQRKRNAIEELKKQVYRPLNESGVGADAAAMGAAAVGITLLDVYATVGRHADVLDVLEQRFPHANGGNDVIDWFNKINTMFETSTNSLETYVSCFKGQAAENLAVELLREHGIDADLFEDLTNETNDIVAHLRNGREIAYSVKCGDTDYIRQCIENTDATHYIINSESYADLEASGLLDYYERSGIEIIDGDYSDSMLTATAENAFDEIHDAADIGDSVPYLALAMLGFKSYQNYKQYKAGKQSVYELGSNIAVDAARVGAAGIFADVGAEIGMSIGTMLCPGVGTVIGGGIGIFAGAILGGSLFEWGKEKLKWGKIIAAQDYFGAKFMERFDESFSDRIVDKVMRTPEIRQRSQEEQLLLEDYESELNPYSPVPVSLPAVLSLEYSESLRDAEEKIIYTKRTLGSHVVKFCNDIATQNVPKQADKFGRRLIGELIIGNEDCLDKTPEERDLITKYREQKAIANNYPYQFSTNAREVMENLIRQIYNSYVPGIGHVDLKHGVMVCLIAACIIAGIVTWIMF